MDFKEGGEDQLLVCTNECFGTEQKYNRDFQAYDQENIAGKSAVCKGKDVSAVLL